MVRQPRAGLPLARWSPQGLVQHRGPDSVVASIPERAVLLTAKSSPRRRRQREDITASGPGTCRCRGRLLDDAAVTDRLKCFGGVGAVISVGPVDSVRTGDASTAQRQVRY